ncbi:hypothetical protein E4634_03485 [Mangrovimicrobium sediminis]|uniref:Uncharacterized protein n=1 Tax=Mangrovimicrobium sediminis TaxID=2562682 RepID=A0A4Z0M6Z3_9GAMM|nr:hypothetical protein E4634_03485 [Haliea sp. SAOS-164]
MDTVGDNLDLITALEGRLKAAVNLSPRGEQRWVMTLRLLYDGHPAGNLSFNLDGYDAGEAEALARNIPHHPGLMREIDEYLWGESD